VSGPAFTPYQRRLFVMLSVASFFDGYDTFAIAQVLPNLREAMGLSPAVGGAIVSASSLGTVASYFIARLADRYGRRPLLTITIAGYTAFTFLSGLAPDAYTFAGAQFFSRAFLSAEWAISIIYAAEEFPAHRRGMVIGVVQAFTSLGAITCASIAPALLATPWGWRSVFLVGILPLILLMYVRRDLRETERFERELASAGPRGIEARALLAPLRTGHRKWIFRLGAIWALTYMCTNVAGSFWKEFAVGERGFTDAQVGASIGIAALAAMPLVFLAGRILDMIGRRTGGASIFAATAAGVFLAFTVESQGALIAALVVAIFGISATTIVLNAFASELFPTSIRAEAFAWCGMLLGRIGFVTAPAIVGALAGYVGYGLAVRSTSACLVIGLILILALLPETRTKELEETSRLA
jgi:putative MFS transporter